TRAAEASRAAASAPRVAVVPTRAAVQGIAALAVHDPERRFDDDVVAMTNAAGATRYGEVTVAERPFWTMAGVCAEGDVLGLVEDDVVVIGDDVAAAASDVLGRMLAAGGEMVTLIVGDGAPPGLADGLEEQVRAGHLGVDTVVYDGRQRSSLLLIGVE
ncbi:dihydroxyacetone kinase, partial [Streptomyces nanshensis]